MSRWRKKPPDKPGLWWFRERGLNDTLLLIVGNAKRTEVSEDDTLSQELGRDLGEYENYWGMTDTKRMSHGEWKFERDAKEQSA